MRLEIGVESAIWYDHERPEESIRFIKECGFETVDFDFHHLFKNTFDRDKLTSFYDKSLEELFEYFKPLKMAAEKHGITFTQTHGVMWTHSYQRDDISDYLIEAAEKTIALCEYLGCKNLVVHPWHGPEVRKEEEREINLNTYRRLMPAAKKHGITICLENLFCYYDSECFEGGCSYADEVCWYIDTLNKEAGGEVFGFCLDVGHAVLTGANLYQYITMLGSRLKVLHIHDNNGLSDSHMIPFTQLERNGKRLRIDWEKMICGLKEIGYEGTISFETFRGIEVLPEELRKDGLIFISAIGRYLRNCLD